MKIIDAIRESITNNRQFFGVEFFPPHMEAGRLKLYDCMERLFHQTEPLFCGVTWGDGGSTSRNTIEIADAAQRIAPVLMQVHLTGAGCSEQQLSDWLQDIKRRDLQNLFLLRGVRIPMFHRIKRQQQIENNTSDNNNNNTSNNNDQNGNNNNNKINSAGPSSNSTSPTTTSHNISALLHPAEKVDGVTGATGGGSSILSTSPATSSTSSLLPHKASWQSNNNNNNNNSSDSDNVNTQLLQKPPPPTVIPKMMVKNSPLQAKISSTEFLPANNNNNYNQPPKECFEHAIDLVRFVRKNFGSHFGITVAGYPEGHHDGEDRATSIKHLKAKIDAGADLVICQFVFDAETFLRFCEDCRSAGITCPIIPSIVAVHSLAHFKRMSNLRKHAGMEELEQKLKEVTSSHNTDDDEAVRDVVVEFLANLVRKLFRSGVRGVYFMTSNIDSVTKKIISKVAELNSNSISILSNNSTNNSSNRNSQHSSMTVSPAVSSPTGQNGAQGLFGMNSSSAAAATTAANISCDRPLPWKQSLHHAEHARPIYWSSRPASYLAALEGISRYDDHPNGRWSSASSPAFGEQSNYQHVKELINATAKLCPSFLQVRSLQDVSQAFVDFLEGKGSLPWSAGDGLAAESDALLKNVLLPMNKRGLLTINSQPAVNGVPSEDKCYGWGPRGGFVYQKQYLEFFCSPAALDKVISIFETFPSVVYMAQRRDKTGRRTNMASGQKWVEEGYNNNKDESDRKSQKERNRVLTSTKKNFRREQQDQISLSGLLNNNGAGSGGNSTDESSNTNDSSSGNNNKNDNNSNNNQQQQRRLGSHLHAAVTWGVFPSQDIVQPTFVSSSAFDVWTPEAFTMWLYPFHGHSSSEQIPHVIHDIVEGWFLVTALDNDYNGFSQRLSMSNNNNNNNNNSDSGSNSVHSSAESTSVPSPIGSGGSNPPSSPTTLLPSTEFSVNYSTPLNEAVGRICSILPEL